MTSSSPNDPVSPRRRSLARRLVRLFLWLVLAIAIATGAVVNWGFKHGDLPGPLPQDTAIVIEKGAGIRQIADQLMYIEALDGTQGYYLFIVWARVASRFGGLKAGEYTIPAHASIRDIVKLLRDGKTVARRLVVPEGLTVAEIMALVKNTDGLDGDLPPPYPEGSLLPDTYFFSHGDRRAEILERMKRGMDAVLDEAWKNRADNLPFDTRLAGLTLASIVEKETGKPEERAHIAGVFVNRLRAGIPLQSDPTVIYALTQGQGKLDRLLTRKDLTLDHPYNTYGNPGLPPGPICNPGRAAIMAALNPLTTKDLYFVADGTGGHAFAETLAEHNRNVARWRSLQGQ